MWELVSFLILVSLLALIHEFGHYLTAIHYGVWVERFSIGIGKKLYSKTINGTEYCISLLPIGGYVRMHGEPYAKKDEDKKIDNKISFAGKKIWQKSLIVIAGPMANFILSLFIFIGMYAIWGEPQMAPIVGEVYDGKPAQIAGMKPGDKIIKIDGLTINSWKELTLRIQEGKGKPSRIKVKRNNEIMDLVLTPELTEVTNGLGEKTNLYMVGIKSSMKIDNKKIPLHKSIYRGAENTFLITKNTVITITRMFIGAVSTKHLSGPVGIAQIAGNAAKNGVQSFLFAMAVISIGLAILNMLPIPLLDGGHLMFFMVEAITGRTLSEKAMEISLKFGLSAITIIFGVAIFNDLAKIF